MPIASTCLPLYNENLEMRQGPYLLFRWPESFPDARLDCQTPGLIDDQKFIELNTDLRHHKSLEGDLRDPLRRDAAQISLGRLKTKIHMLQKSMPFASLHVELPEVPQADQFTGQTVYYGVLPKKIRNSTFEDQRITSKIKDRATVAAKKADSEDRTENFFIPMADAFDTHLYVRDFDHEFRRDERVLEMYFKATVDEGDPRSYKPSNNETRKIEEILRKPNFATLDPKEKSLIWKFRYSLIDKPEALPKVLKSDMSSTQETEAELCSLIKEWTKIKYDDAIYLLSRDFALNSVVVKSFSEAKLLINSEIRRHAVDILREEDYEVLDFIFLQLVSALKYERIEESVDLSPLLRFMIDKSLGSKKLCNYFFWHIGVECESKDPRVKKWYEDIRRKFVLEVAEKAPDLHANLELHQRFRLKIQAVTKEVVTKESKAEKRKAGSLHSRSTCGTCSKTGRPARSSKAAAKPKRAACTSSTPTK